MRCAQAARLKRLREGGPLLSWTQQTVRRQSPHTRHSTAAKCLPWPARPATWLASAPPSPKVLRPPPPAPGAACLVALPLPLGTPSHPHTIVTHACSDAPAEGPSPAPHPPHPPHHRSSPPLWTAPAGCLDYIWCSRGHWAVEATLDLPYTYSPDPRYDVLQEEPEAGPGQDGQGRGGREEGRGGAARGLPPAAGGAAGSCEEGLLGMAGWPGVGLLPELPTAQWPSDHLAVGARLRLLAGG